jgi:GNAT superfamily N-acetyltransferase
MRPISFEENADEVAAELDTRLGQFNDQQAGPRNRLKFVLAVRDDDGELLGGLVGETLWNTLYVGVLWVHAQHRGSGYGTALMERAEQVARERDCDIVFLNTMTFQAPAFYAKLGYVVFGELVNVPRGHRRLWFCKRLPGARTGDRDALTLPVQP